MLQSKFYLLFFIIFCFSCKREQEITPLTDDDLLLAYSEFECIAPSFEPSTYFKGKIGNKDLCYYDGVDNIYTINEVESNTVTITKTPELTLNTDNPNSRQGNSLNLFFYRSDIERYQTTLKFFTPFSTRDSTMKQYIDKYFTKPSITILDKENAGKYPFENKEGIQVYIFTCKSPGISTGLLSTVDGKQTSGRYIKVKKAEKVVVFGKIYYDIVLDIKCDLYKTWGTGSIFYATLEGEYATRLLYE